MRVLILSDVHGNLAALETVLAAETVFDRAVFLGDAVDYGPEPAACLARLEALSPVRVRGNHDNAAAFDVDCQCSTAFRELSAASRRHTRAALSPEQLAGLGCLPTATELSFGGQRVYLTHATPRDNLFEYVSPAADFERWKEAMTPAPGDPSGPASSGTPWLAADAILVGHTHRPYVRALGRRTIVNPGSVGQPRDGDPRAAYAVWEDGRFELRRVDYDVARTVRGLRASPLPAEVAEALAQVLTTGGL